MPKEINLDSKAAYSSMTDELGIICNVSEDFAAVSGYGVEEMVGKNHNIVRHPDMPKIIFKILWDKLDHNKNFIGFIKNRTKDGNYYWILNKIFLYERHGGHCKYASHKYPVSTRSKLIIEQWYEKLLEEEEKGGLEASEAYLNEYLDFRGVTYDEYIETLIDAKGMLKAVSFMARKLFH